MENNIITLPGNVDVSLVDGVRREFIIHAIYDPASSTISNPFNFNSSDIYFVAAESDEEILNAVKSGYDIKLQLSDLSSILFHLFWVDFDLIVLFERIKYTEIDGLYGISLEIYDIDDYNKYRVEVRLDEEIKFLLTRIYGGDFDSATDTAISTLLTNYTDGRIINVNELVDSTTYRLDLQLTTGNNPEIYATASDVYYAVTKHSNNTVFCLRFNLYGNDFYTIHNLTIRLASATKLGNTWILISEVFFMIDSYPSAAIIKPYIIHYEGAITNSDSSTILFSLSPVEELLVNGYVTCIGPGGTQVYMSGTGIFDPDYSSDDPSNATTVFNVIGGRTQVATPTDINTVTAIAEGKTKAYVTNKTKMSALNSSNDTVTISSFTDLNNTTVALSNFKVGDIIYLTDTEIPDRWVSSITKSGDTVTALVLSKMETSKVDLNSYVPTSRTIAGVDLQDNITKAELQSATDDSTHRFVTDTEKTTWNNKVSANNSTITIQKNGTTVDSFTTNTSSAKTININTTDDLKVKNNATSSLVSSSFLFRQTANGTAGVDNGFARIEKMKGNTVVWNQLLKDNYVDLGLPSGLLWATCNIGATTPDGYGLYFTWGNVDGRAEGSGYNFNLDNYNSSTGASLTTDIPINEKYDAARNNCGLPWRLPSSTEFMELYSNCSSEIVTINGVTGVRFTSNINGNSIFFPAGGSFINTTLYGKNVNGRYWNTTNYTNTHAFYIRLDSSEITSRRTTDKFQGMNLRPVVPSGIFTDGEYNHKILVKSNNAFDLTLMFGAGNEPTTVAQFEAMFPEPYYAYDAGRLLSFNPAGLKTVGFNLIDGWVENAYIADNDGIMRYNDQTNTNATNWIKVLPNTVYRMESQSDSARWHCWYDKNKNFISGLNGYFNYDITSPSNAAYYRATIKKNAIGTTCFHLKGDGSKDNTYEAHLENNLQIPITTLKGKVVTNGVAGGSDVVMFPYGLCSAGSVYDEIDLKNGRAVKRVGSVNFGSLTIIFANNYFVCNGSNIGAENPANTVAANVICPNYNAISLRALSVSTDKKIAVSGTNQFYIRDSAYSDDQSFRNAMNGVYIYYELATPIEYQFDPISDTYPIDALGTEEIVFNSGTAPITVPALMDIRYSTNAIDTVKNLPNVYVSAVQEQAFSEKEKELARKNIGAVSVKTITETDEEDSKYIDIINNHASKDTNVSIESSADMSGSISTVSILSKSTYPNVYIATATGDSGNSAEILLNKENINLNTTGTGKVKINNNEVITTSKTAASGGTDLSLVTTGDKYNWNNKVSSTTITAIQVVSSMPASPDSNTLYIVQ